MAAKVSEQSANNFLPAELNLTSLRSAAAGCRGCDLYLNANQTVFSVGPRHASLFFIGEQPGDQEDRLGKPFVGPAGHVLDRAMAECGIDRAMAECGIDRSKVYLTNAVKHFKFTERGKRRIHEKPNRTEIKACQPWLAAELSAVRPDMVVLLGATAAQSVMGSSFKLTQEKGKVVEIPAEFSGQHTHAVATFHPSAVLRATDRKAAFEELVRDLKSAVTSLDR